MNNTRDVIEKNYERCTTPPLMMRQPLRCPDAPRRKKPPAVIVPWKVDERDFEDVPDTPRFGVRSPLIPYHGLLMIRK